MKTIKCSCGQDILVDDDMLDYLSRFFWSCSEKAITRRISTTSGVIAINMASEIVEVPVGLVPDHKDRDRHNMQRENIRPATYSQNGANRRIASNNTSGYKGVHRTRKTWSFEVKKDDIRYQKHGYRSAESAARARDRKAIELFGEFATTNFPRSDYGSSSSSSSPQSSGGSSSPQNQPSGA